MPQRSRLYDLANLLAHHLWLSRSGGHPRLEQGRTPPNLRIHSRAFPALDIAGHPGFDNARLDDRHPHAKRPQFLRQDFAYGFERRV